MLFVPTVRWVICGLLFLATTINYIDRQVIGILKPVLERELGWTEAQYGLIVLAFQSAYAIMLPLTGRFIDAVGTRLGYMLAVVVWSLAAMGHALAGSAAQFSIARFALGVGEAANFPAAVKTVADWFPPKERAFATGIFNSGSNIGAIIAPLMVPWIAVTWGWREAFLITGALGFIWVVLWWFLYREPHEHPMLSEAERAYITAGREGEQTSVRVPYRLLLSRRAAWAFLLGKFLTDPIWWFYLYWLPGFLNKEHGVDLTQLGPPLITIYLAADIGSIGGGWLPSFLMARGYTLNAARKLAMLACAVSVTSAMFVGATGGNLWAAVALISIAAAAHQGWSANLFTLASDIFPRRWVGSVVGLGGMGGAIGGMLVAPAIGYWLDWSGTAYGPLFVIAGSMYLVALGLIQFLVPDIPRAQLENSGQTA